MDDKPYDAGDAEQVNEARKTSGRKTKAKHEIVRKMMQDPSGRAFFFEELSACHIFSPSFAPDTHVMAFKEGERNRGLKLLSDIMASSSDLYLTMMSENKR